MSTPTWKCMVHDPAVQRSSHILSVIGHAAYIFGGELIPRQPRDNKTISIELGLGANDFSITEVTTTSEPPSARVGTACATLSSKVYIFSGRGGPSMSPTEESGGLWCFDHHHSTWSLITPSDSSAPYPSARSYHCMTSDGADKIYVHAGCPTSGRLADLWVFSVKERTWKQLADAPGPARGGTSIAFSGGKLYRMNGFDGKVEQGGTIDVYSTQGDKWTTKDFVADGIVGPEARSVSALLPMTIDGRAMLVTLFGERDPSNLGHAGAGKMLQDLWLFDIEKEEWRKEETNSTQIPPARGWFDADVLEASKVVVAGGLNEMNERLDDVWVLAF